MEQSSSRSRAASNVSNVEEEQSREDEEKEEEVKIESQVTAEFIILEKMLGSVRPSPSEYHSQCSL